MELFDPIRWLMSATIGTRWVTLIDCEATGGQRHVRRIWFDARGRPKATRVGFGIRHVTLIDGGVCGKDGYYVERWEPYIPFSRVPRHERRYPVWEAQP